MHVDDKLIDKLSRLSMLQFSDSEKETVKEDLQKMIGFIEKLNELDTTGVPPLLHMSARQDVLREDVPGHMLTQEEALQNASQHNREFFQVPKVIKK